jgi:hypothetical protein
MSDYVYLVFRRGQPEVVAACDDLGTADRWIWRNADDTRNYFSLPKFVHPAGSLDGPTPDPQPATPPRVGVTLAEYHQRWSAVSGGVGTGPADGARSERGHQRPDVTNRLAMTDQPHTNHVTGEQTR